MRYQVRKATDDGGELLHCVYDAGTRQIVARYTREILAEIAADRLEKVEERMRVRATTRIVS